MVGGEWQTVFQSTFPHGERRCSCEVSPSGFCSFNPRSRTGNDLHYLAIWRLQWVSIHVPARGTTRFSSSSEFASFCFNPRSRTGNDRISLCSFHGRALFQSTFPHGERQKPNEKDKYWWQFQSTFPHGERLRRWQITRWQSKVSIHVPARGTTSIDVTALCDCICFNPRSRTGNDEWRSRLPESGKRFQSTFPHGERRRAE